MKSTRSDRPDFLKKALQLYYWKPSLAIMRAVELEILSRMDMATPTLDLGCGDGLFTKTLFECIAPPRMKIYGIDISQKRVLKAKTLRIYTDLRAEDATNMSFETGYFATVLSNCVLEHILDLDTVLVEVARVLKKGGRLILTVPSHKFDEYLFFGNLLRKYRLNRLADAYVRDLNKRLKQIHRLSPEVWQRKLINVGLIVKDVSYYLPRPLEQMWSVYTFQILRCFAILKFLKLHYPRTICIDLLDKLLRRAYETYSGTNKTDGGGLLIVATKP